VKRQVSGRTAAEQRQTITIGDVIYVIDAATAPDSMLPHVQCIA